MATWDYEALTELGAEYRPATVRLSGDSLALLLSALGTMDKRGQWRNAGARLTDPEWDTMDENVSRAYKELMTPMIGWIVPIVLETLPEGWLACDGAEYDAEDYPDLFAVLDNVYKTSATTFVVPDLRFRSLVGESSGHVAGEMGGEEEHTLLEEELAIHTHTNIPHTHTYSGVVLSVETIGADVVPIPSVTGAVLITSADGITINNTGASQPHNNMHNYLVCKHAIIAR